MPGLDADYGGKGVLVPFVFFSSFGLGLGSIFAFSRLILTFR